MKYVFLVFLSLIVLIACKGTDESSLRTFSGEALGTGYQVQFYTDIRFPVREKFDSVIQAVNKSMSTYIPDSDISRINDGDTTVVVDHMFRDVLNMAREVYEQTGGYYDPTVGILVNAYGFGPENDVYKLNQSVLDSLRHFVGLDEISLSPEGKVRKDNSAVYLDFNSIGKGYCIDRVGVMLEQNGVTNYLIEMGGELRSRGINLEKESDWKIGIENIDAPVTDRSYTRVVRLKDRGMAGSGNYRKFRMDSTTGKKFVHTVNPLTGLAEESDVLSTTVIAETCAEADAYATAFMAMGLDRSKDVLDKLEDVSAYIMYAKADTTGIFLSKGFDEYLVAE